MDIPGFETFWREGSVELPPRPMNPDGGAFDLLRADPERHPLATPSGKVELFSSTVHGFGYPDCPGLPTWLEPAEWLGSPLAGRFPLHLVSNQPRTRLHSQYDGGDYSQAAKIAGREPLLMHPRDAHARGVRDGDVVRVFNDRGACLAGVRLSESVRPGVVVLATGAWYDPAPDGLDRHGNPNVLTRDAGTSRLAQGPSSGTTLVEVVPEEGEPPRVQAFDPPEVIPEAR
ncbi:molybdopterin dinucleotide binding domain-containing protein [Prauserella oleivorans]